MLVGAPILGYGLLLVPASVLDSLHRRSLLLSGVFAAEWAGDRFGLAPGTRRTLSIAFAGLAAILLVAFVVVNYASFKAGETASGGRVDATTGADSAAASFTGSRPPSRSGDSRTRSAAGASGTRRIGW